MRSSGGPLAERERGLGQLAALGDVPAHDPVAPQRATSASAVSASPGGDRVAQRGAQVVVVGVEPRQPLRQLGAAHALLGAAEQLRVGVRVAVADRVGVLELFERVFADGLEHPEAAAVAGEQAVVGERGDAVEGVGAADGLGGLRA